MKTAIYIEDAIIQIVLTPQNKFEKDIVTELSKEKTSIKVFEGSFYDCRGGWIRQEEYAKNHKPNFKNSLIIRIDKEEPISEQEIKSNLKIVQVSDAIFPDRSSATMVKL